METSKFGLAGVKKHMIRPKKVESTMYYGTLSLASAISDVKHIFHEYELTDHATSYFTIHFLKTEMGPGVFRAHPLCSDIIAIKA